MAVTFKHRVYNLSVEEVEKKINKIPPEPGMKYFVIINRKRFPIKQVVSITFKISPMEFSTVEAHRVLRQVGFEIVEQP